jgi:hypothetical protein
MIKDNFTPPLATPKDLPLGLCFPRQKKLLAYFDDFPTFRKGFLGIRNILDIGIRISIFGRWFGKNAFTLFVGSFLVPFHFSVREKNMSAFSTPRGICIPLFSGVTSGPNNGKRSTL